MLYETPSAATEATPLPRRPHTWEREPYAEPTERHCGKVSGPQASRSTLEALLLYSDFMPLCSTVRLLGCAGKGLVLLARWTRLAKFTTGIEIHPGANIGHRLSSTTAWALSSARLRRSATTVCHLYQGVTLGGTGKDKGKRHPPWATM